MFNKKGKAAIVTLLGTVGLILIPNYNQEADNNVSADDKEEIVEKVAYTDIPETSTRFTIMEENRGFIEEDESEEDRTELTENDTNKYEQVTEGLAPEETNNAESSESGLNKKTEASTNKAEKKTEKLKVETKKKDNNTISKEASENKKDKNIPPKQETQKEEEKVQPKEEATEEKAEKVENPTLTPKALFRNGSQVGSRIYGEKFTYYGDRTGLQYSISSDTVIDLYVGDEYHLDENYLDRHGNDRKILAEAYTGLAIVNKTDSGGYVIYMLYPK